MWVQASTTRQYDAESESAYPSHQFGFKLGSCPCNRSRLRGLRQAPRLKVFEWEQRDLQQTANVVSMGSFKLTRTSRPKIPVVSSRVHHTLGGRQSRRIFSWQNTHLNRFDYFRRVFRAQSNPPTCHSLVQRAS